MGLTGEIFFFALEATARQCSTSLCKNESLTALASPAARLPYCPILFTLPIMQKKIAVQKGPV